MHPFYVSMTEISYNQQDKKLEMSVRIFTDDLEKALAKNCNCKADLSRNETKESMNAILSKYLEKNLRIYPDGKLMKFEFIGYEREEESTWSFLEIDCDKSPENLKVDDRLLYDVQKQQSNLVRFKKTGFDKTVQVTYPDSEITF